MSHDRMTPFPAPVAPAGRVDASFVLAAIEQFLGAPTGPASLLLRAGVGCDRWRALSRQQRDGFVRLHLRGLTGAPLAYVNDALARTSPRLLNLRLLDEVVLAVDRYCAERAAVAVVDKRGVRAAGQAQAATPLPVVQATNPTLTSILHVAGYGLAGLGALAAVRGVFAGGPKRWGMLWDGVGVAGTGALLVAVAGARTNVTALAARQAAVEAQVAQLAARVPGSVSTPPTT